MPDRRALQRAWDLLAFLLGERADAPTDFDPTLVAQVAAAHRLDAALAEPGFAAVPPQRHLPSTIVEDWRRARAGALGESTLRMPLLRRTLEDLRPFPIVLFKGLPIAELIYASPGARAMGDVDVLVRAADLLPVMKRLRELGFAHLAGPATHLDRSCFFEWTFERPGLSLDLHRGWTYPARLPIDYQPILDRSRPWTALAENARLLDPEDAFLCQALQGPLTEFSPNAFPWIVMLDLREMLKPGPFWPGVSERSLDRALICRRATEWGVRDMIAATLRAGGTIFASLRELAALATPLLTATERARCNLATMRSTPPAASQSPLWIRMARRAFLTQTRLLPAVTLQAVERKLFSRAPVEDRTP